MADEGDLSPATREFGERPSNPLPHAQPSASCRRQNLGCNWVWVQVAIGRFPKSGVIKIIPVISTLNLMVIWSAKCEMRGVKCKVRGVKCEV